MQAKIIDENEEGIAVDITDNNGVIHEISMFKNGSISYHNQETYADEPEKRRDENDEHVEQARRFAQYYVYAERGYDTVPPEIHPERIAAVRQTIQNLSDADFKDLFGDLYQQLQSYHSNTPRAISIPDDAAGPNSVYYRQQVYLGLDSTQLPDEVESLAATHGIDLDNADSPVSELSNSARSAWQSFTEQFGNLAQRQEFDANDTLEICGVSSLHTAYIDSRGIEHFEDPAEDPFDREPDTLIELAPVDPGPLDEFREFLDHHLKCQIRDCFIRMGLRPPEEYRVLGPGHIEAAERYKKLEMYPDFTDPENEQLLAK